MAQVTIRANLSSVQIPLLTEEFGRSVIVRQQDLNYVPTVTSKSDVDKDIGIPQIYYAHNVMPTYYGYRSIAFSTQIPGVGLSTFSQVFSLISPTGLKAFLAINTDGAVYNCYPSGGYVWNAISGFKKLAVTEGTNTGTGYVGAASIAAGGANDTYTATALTASTFQIKKNGVNEAVATVATEYTSADSKLKITILAGDVDFIAGDIFTVVISDATFTGSVTTATVGGVVLIGSEGQGVFEYDFTTNSLTYRALVGVDSSSILGITSANGYLIVYSIDAVLWSSVVDPLDFVPSLATGAGGGSVEDAKGAIRRVVSLTSGFLVFTAANAVAAQFSQNLRYPFTFREIPNAGGLSDLSLITDEADSTSVYAFTSYGLQQISTQKASLVMPELSDFLTGKRFEDFDSSSLSFYQTDLTSPLKKRVEFISGRFLVISYGMTSFTHAIIYDTALQRFGKVKIPHVSVFQYGFLDADDADTAKKQIAFLQADGTVKTVEFASGFSSDDSVALIGKFQYIRSRVLQLEEVEVETVEVDTDFTCYDYATRDGKTFSGAPAQGFESVANGQTKLYRFHKTGMNHSLLFKGTFKLNSLQLTFTVGGDR